MGNSFGKNCTVLHESCTTALDANNLASKIDLSFLDPPFNQDKAYNAWNDNLPPEKYWEWMREICGKGTTLVTTEQLGWKSIGIELDSHNVTLIQNRLAEQRESDKISRFFKDTPVPQT